LEEREEISRGLCAGRSLRQIARQLNRAPSTLSREIARNGGLMRYRAARAERCAWTRSERPKPCVLAQRPRLRELVSDKLRAKWSPMQISRWLALEYPLDESLRVSHETIYQSLFIQARGALKKELIEHLRRTRKLRRPRKRRSPKGRQGRIIDALSIRERPAEAEDRAVPGHWEGDLLIGSVGSQVATLVERHTRYLMLVKVPSRQSADVVNALARQVRKLPKELRRSLTWDRGRELAAHKDFTLATQVQVYFCDPRSPWQRGSNENTNGLLRQYFPKGHDLSGITQSQFDRVARQLNERPRETLGFRTPAQRFAECVALNA
jgi:IS30 family transposase